MAWDAVCDLYIDVDRIGASSCLLDGLSAAARADRPGLVAGDILTVRVHFRRVDDGDSQAVQLDGDEAVVLAAKAAYAGDLLAAVTEWTSGGTEDDPYIEGVLDLTADAVRLGLGDEEEIPIHCDIEVSTNTRRGTYRFQGVLRAQVYDGDTPPVPVGGPALRWEEYTNARGAWCIRIRNKEGVVLAAFAPPGEEP